ncbi:MAG: rod shape-determining protein [Candidatus Paceibacterota bacterium]
MTKKIRNWFAINQQIGLDLGSSTVRITLPAQEKQVTQAAVVARNMRTDQIVAIGDAAEKTLGRTPAHIETMYPIVEGVVDDSASLESLISMLLYQNTSGLFQFIGRNILVALPASVTDVDVRIIGNTLQKSGAREVMAVPASIAGLVGVGAPVGDPTTQLVVNIGSGITQIAAVSDGSVVTEASSSVAGNQFDLMIVQYIADDFGLRISSQQARRIKHELGAVRGWSDEPGEKTAVSGQDEASSLPREINIARIDITEAIDPLISDLVDFIQAFIRSLSADMVADISSHGLHLVGGGSRLAGLGDHLASVLDVSVHERVNPEQVIMEGLGYIIDREDGDQFTQLIRAYESTK